MAVKHIAGCCCADTCELDDNGSVSACAIPTTDLTLEFWEKIGLTWFYSGNSHTLYYRPSATLNGFGPIWDSGEIRNMQEDPVAYSCERYILVCDDVAGVGQRIHFYEWRASDTVQYICGFEEDTPGEVTGTGQRNDYQWTSDSTYDTTCDPFHLWGPYFIGISAQFANRIY